MARKPKTNRRNPDGGHPSNEPAAQQAERERQEERAILNKLAADGGGVANKDDMWTEYRRLLKAGWKP